MYSSLNIGSQLKVSIRGLSNIVHKSNVAAVPPAVPVASQAVAAAPEAVAAAPKAVAAAL
jgi:hypothetical protein